MIIYFQSLEAIPQPVFSASRSTSPWLTVRRDADILWMDGTDTGLDATIYDPMGIFATLTSVGATGLCLLQGDRYYVIQAPCP